MQRSFARLVYATALALGLITGPLLMGANGDEADNFPTTTLIKHLVIIFQENESFDHYFGTYPNAQNPAGEPRFIAVPGTPSVNGLTPALLNFNPNSVNPFRYERSQRDPNTSLIG